MIARTTFLSLAPVLVPVLVVPAGTDARTRPLVVTVGGIDAHGRLPDRAAFCPPAGAPAKDVSPSVRWSQGPEGTQSYALLMTDPDVPADFGQIDKPGVTIAENAPRTTVYHWVLADIPARLTGLAEGAEGNGVVPHGKPAGATDHGRRGANGYTAFLASNPDMAGTYGGYDGPCPPANDDRVHRYIVRVFALDVPALDLGGAFDGAALEKAVRGHVLATGAAVATFSLKTGQ